MKTYTSAPTPSALRAHFCFDAKEGVDFRIVATDDGRHGFEVIDKAPEADTSIDVALANAHLDGIPASLKREETSEEAARIEKHPRPCHPSASLWCARAAP